MGGMCWGERGCMCGGDVLGIEIEGGGMGGENVLGRGRMDVWGECVGERENGGDVLGRGGCMTLHMCGGGEE